MINQMFSQMHQAALARLVDYAPEEVARNAGVRYEGEFMASYPENRVIENFSRQRRKCIGGAAVSGKWKNFDF